LINEFSAKQRIYFGIDALGIRLQDRRAKIAVLVSILTSYMRQLQYSQRIILIHQTNI